MTVRPIFTRAAALTAAAMLAACAGHESAHLTAAPAIGYASGSRFASDLTARDKAALARAFDAAMETGQAGAPEVWSSGEYQGAITPGGVLVAGLKPDQGVMTPLAAPLDLGTPLETELGLYALTATANVRAGPSLKSPVLGQLGAGTGVDVLGKVPGKPWMLVAVDGALRGYVHSSLMIKAPGDDLTLAGGPTRTPVTCRSFEEHLTYSGQSDEWAGVACKRDGTWIVEHAPPSPTSLTQRFSN